MSISCIPHKEISPTVSHNSERFLPEHFLLGLAISMLIWASLVAGIMVSAG